MPDEARAKTFFGNDMTDEQWAEYKRANAAPPGRHQTASARGYR